MSSPPPIPFFGRTWSLTITPSQGPAAGTPIVISSSSWEPEALRVTFDINQLAYSAFWQAEIVIWNANGPITYGPSEGVNLYQAVIQEGDTVTLAAGYQYDGAPTIIWTGPIFYTIQSREAVIDQTLTLYCLLNRALSTQNFLNDTLPARSTQFNQARFIAEQATTKIQIDQSQLQTNLDSANGRGAQNLPRGKSYFGNPHHYLKALADQNGLLSWFDSTHWNTASLTQITGPVVASYAPTVLEGGPPIQDGNVKLSLIGQPQQTQYGVNFRVLLDPTVQIKPPLPQVTVQNQYVRQAPISYPLPSGTYLARPLVNTYVVVGVRFTGDTRGNNWYSDITGFSIATDIIALVGNPTGN
jgi:hypothetical protein